MRQFVCLGHELPTDADFSLDDLPGAGRLDALCRSITAALLVSHDIREDVRVHVVCRDELAITFDGSELRRLNPDERSTAALVRTALDAREEAIGAMPAEPSPGISLYRRGIEATLDAVAGEGPLLTLHEDGDPLAETEPPADPVFVLSDHRDFTEREGELLAERADRRLRIGPTRVHADQAITVAHNWLDTDGYTAY
ncbi:tRNA (pseudouridine(54)-N(1))-methyltransferase TrmY [Saliphagus infecundisoli]|uniref:tRNA (pseudouridine(54)-N(1))-methyltransferase n=1 Tax=Saliphagus infecundisoli TaxID=1849069 RepID=A0ABD5QIG2_9EURY|nr:tRNA (pseudouridine(54)-N(1))-methyltransferase TrmY [Saliphagus infecundisoli]